MPVRVIFAAAGPTPALAILGRGELQPHLHEPGRAGIAVKPLRSTTSLGPTLTHSVDHSFLAATLRSPLSQLLERGQLGVGRGLEAQAGLAAAPVMSLPSEKPASASRFHLPEGSRSQRNSKAGLVEVAEPQEVALQSEPALPSPSSNMVLPGAVAD